MQAVQWGTASTPVHMVSAWSAKHSSAASLAMSDHAWPSTQCSVVCRPFCPCQLPQAAGSHAQQLGASIFVCDVCVASAHPRVSAPWFSYPEVTPSSNHYLETLAARPNFGISISGGGYRAATTALGYIRCVPQLALQAACGTMLGESQWHCATMLDAMALCHNA